MTTTVKVHVNGNYQAEVQQDDRPAVNVGPGEEKSFYLPHPASGVFRITETYLGEKAASNEPAGEEKTDDAAVDRASIG